MAGLDYAGKGAQAGLMEIGTAHAVVVGVKVVETAAILLTSFRLARPPVALGSACDYINHMIRSLRESKARLSELVEQASRGEDILISVRGKIKARLTRAEPEPAFSGAEWAEQLRRPQRTHGTGRRRLSVERLIGETREDRR